MAQSAIMPCNDEESAGGDDTPAFLWRTETHDFFRTCACCRLRVKRGRILSQKNPRKEKNGSGSGSGATSRRFECETQVLKPGMCFGAGAEAASFPRQLALNREGARR